MGNGQNNFPIKIRVSAQDMQELRECEYGSYEDNIKPDGTRLYDYANGKLHIVELIDRSPICSIITLANQEELDEFFGASMSGTWSIYCPRSARRIYRQLQKLVDPKIVKLWPYDRLGS